MIRAELKKIWQNKMLLITIVAICFVPILYAGVFLKGVWDPYGHLDKLKVAIVNNDKPVSSGGQTFNVGQSIVKSLRNNHTFDWQFVDDQTAKAGLENNDYYMTITLPKDFSAKAATIKNVDPEQMDIQYKTNGSLNFPIETASSTAVNQIKSQVSAELTTAYANAIIGTIKTTGDGLQTAADGAKQLDDGLNQTTAGVNQLSTSLPSLAGGVSQLADGSSNLADGIDQLVGQTKASGQQVKNSLPQLKALDSGANQLANTLTSSAEAAKEQIGQLNQGLDQLKQFAGTTYATTQGLDRLFKDDEIKAIVDKNPDYQRTVSQLLPSMESQLNNLAKLDIDTIKTQLSSMVEGIKTAGDGASQVASGTKQTYDQINNMSQQLNSSKTRTQLNQLTNGANQLKNGLTSLNGNMPNLVSGANKLDSGMKQLASGGSSLHTKLQSGADTIKQTPLSNKTAQQIASPVAAKQSKLTTVKNYGHGLAPYFMSVSVFIGCMLLNFAYPIRKKADRRQSWLSWYASKVFIGLVAATTMALILGTVMLGIGLQVDHIGQYYSLLILYANAVMFLSMFMAVAFDNPGRFITMLILILSLGTAGGTFPIETAPLIYQAIHKVVPITYSLMGLKSAISSGIASSTVASSYLYLTAMLVINLGLLALAMFILTKLKGNQADQSRLDNNQKLLDDDYGNYRLTKA